MCQGTGTNTSRRLSTKQRLERVLHTLRRRLGIRVAMRGHRVPGTWAKACYRLHSTRQVGLPSTVRVVLMRKSFHRSLRIGIDCQASLVLSNYRIVEK